MSFKSYSWIIIQDIAGFTTLSEKLSKKGKEGSEELEEILNEFFKSAERKIGEKDGVIFKLAGDAYFAIIDGKIREEEIFKMGKSLLNLEALKNNGILSRFIGIKGELVYEKIQLKPNTDLIVKGEAVDELMLFEEKTEAGKIHISSFKKVKKLKEKVPRIEFTNIKFPALHRPLYILFLKITDDLKLLKEITEFSLLKNINIYKWIPDRRAFKALIILGFPEATGKEIEVIADFYFSLKEKFGNNFKMGMSSGIVFSGTIGGDKFKEFGVIGDSVNVASRLCDLSKEGKLLFTEEISKHLPQGFRPVNYGVIKLKGKIKKTRIYSLEKKEGVLVSLKK